jgi:hypothetical protein
MAEQTRLDVLGLQGLARQRVVSQEQCCMPIRMHPLQLIGLERISLHCGTRRPQALIDCASVVAEFMGLLRSVFHQRPSYPIRARG